MLYFLTGECSNYRMDHGMPQSRPRLEALQNQIDDFVTAYEEKLEEVYVLTFE